MQVASARSQVQVASAWSQVQVASARSQVQVASARSQVQLTCEELKSLLSTTRKSTLCGDRRGRGAKTHGFLRFLKFPRDPLRGSAWSRCKNPWFFAISNLLARPSAGIGVVEVQKPMVFCDFQHARATLCGDRRGAKTRGFFAISAVLARPSAGIGVVEVQKPMFFL